jgi:hypothetical protein
MCTHVSHCTPLIPREKGLCHNYNEYTERNTRQFPVETGLTRPPQSPTANHRALSQTAPSVSNNA